jgi:ABC-2 type transport system ATP-binding protein/lipopolysaccharide transport system ATP-binding protein
MSIIEVNGVSLDYPIVGMGSKSLKNRILSTATGGLISGGERIPVVNALRSITFQVQEGDRLGLIGHNGAGKSTLLKVLAGIYQPTKGMLSLTGKVVSTLNLSIGLESEATGIENIISRGLLLGMTRKELNQKLDEIAEFTELGEYLDMPARIYSAGMVTRLAFAVVTAMNADILLMDEIIGTGDAAFMDKAEKRLKEFMSRSKILVLASHSESTIRRFCNKVLLLEHGSLIGIGAIDEMFSMYNERIAA